MFGEQPFLNNRKKGTALPLICGSQIVKWVFRQDWGCNSPYPKLDGGKYAPYSAANLAPRVQHLASLLHTYCTFLLTCSEWLHIMGEETSKV